LFTNTASTREGEKIVPACAPGDEIFRAPHRSAKKFGDTTARAMRHAARSLLHVNFAVQVSPPECGQRADVDSDRCPLAIVDGKNELPQPIVRSIGEQ
jgi:hypothetical protein